MFILRNQTGRLNSEVLGRTLLRFVAAAAFVFYCAWNIFWVSHKKLPPGILIYYTGFPGPTTGCTRAVAALMRGDWRQGILWNPLALIFIALLLLSGAVLFVNWFKKQRIVLPNWLGIAWLVALAAGWGAKFVIGRNYW